MPFITNATKPFANSGGRDLPIPTLPGALQIIGCRDREIPPPAMEADDSLEGMKMKEYWRGVWWLAVEIIGCSLLAQAVIVVIETFG